MKPQGVREAAEAADAMILQMAGEGDTAQTDQPAADGDAETAPLSLVENPSTEPPAEPAPASEVEALRVRLTQAEKERDKADERWRALDGILRATNQKLETLQLLMANKAAVDQSAPAAEPAAPAKPVEVVAENYTADDVDRFGEDLCQYVDKRIKAIVGASVAPLQQDLQSVNQRVDTNSTAMAKSQKDKFLEALTEAVPDWNAIDLDPRFDDWLKQNRLYDDGFTKAFTEFDAVLAAQVFNAWKSANGGTAPATHEEATAAQLEDQVAPERTRSTAVTTQADSQEPKRWAYSEIQAFYADLSKPPGQRKYTGEQSDAIQREIAKAQREQRVDYDK